MAKKLYIVAATRRSGHHAFCEWLKLQDGNCFYEGFGFQDRFNVAPMLDGFRRVMQTIGKKNIILSFEDLKTENINAIDAELRKMYDLSEYKTEKIVFLRDIYNLWASLYKDGKKDKLQIAIRVWKAQADNRDYIIRYNRWFSNNEVRGVICDRLGINFTDNGINNVAGCNGGSSFDGLRFNGNAQKMDVLKRWVKYKKNKDFRKFIKNKELAFLNLAIFGWYINKNCKKNYKAYNRRGLK
ncbi:MAG TPA: hypothetical protein VKS21_03990 [Spirochaetota bacterium]|nr:hypothetical protein [Spirochaetota bacterium]